MELVSIIIPVYNVERYLERCVNSVVNQTYSNIEILLIDDGSTDNSGTLADELGTRDERIKVVHQKNGGLSVARNTGLSIAKGNYIYFVDSDDYIDPDMIKTMYELLIKDDADFVCCGVDVVNDQGHVLYYNDDLDQYLKLNQKEAFYYHVVRENTYISTSSCDKLFRKELLLKKPFVPGVLYEDLRNISFYISQSKRVSYLSKPFYKYYQNSTSLTHGKFNPKWYSWIDANEERIETYKKYAPEYLPLIYSIYVDNVLSILYKSRKDKNNTALRKKIAKDLKDCVKNNNIVFSKKSKIKYVIFKISPRLFYLLMKIYDLLHNR